MKKDCILVLDCQKDFLQGKYAVSGMDKLVIKIAELLKSWGGEVVFTRYFVKKIHGSIKKDLCIPGRSGAEIVDVLSPYSKLKKSRVISKHGYSAFIGTDLNKYLQSKGIERLYLTGVKTEWCVLATALNAFDLGYKVFLVKDCILGRSKKFQELVLAKNYFGKGSIVESRELVRR